MCLALALSIRGAGEGWADPVSHLPAPPSADGDLPLPEDATSLQPLPAGGCALPSPPLHGRTQTVQTLSPTPGECQAGARFCLHLSPVSDRRSMLLWRPWWILPQTPRGGSPRPGWLRVPWG